MLIRFNCLVYAKDLSVLHVRPFGDKQEFSYF
jgi:hypothetical protein